MTDNENIKRNDQQYRQCINGMHLSYSINVAVAYIDIHVLNNVTSDSFLQQWYIHFVLFPPDLSSQSVVSAIPGSYLHEPAGHFVVKMPAMLFKEQYDSDFKTTGWYWLKNNNRNTAK